MLGSGKALHKDCEHSTGVPLAERDQRVNMVPLSAQSLYDFRFEEEAGILMLIHIVQAAREFTAEFKGFANECVQPTLCQVIIPFVEFVSDSALELAQDRPVFALDMLMLVQTPPTTRNEAVGVSTVDNFIWAEFR